jgi:hypothetical protein
MDGLKPTQAYTGKCHCPANWQSTTFRITGLGVARHVVNRRDVPGSVHLFEAKTINAKVDSHVSLPTFTSTGTAW